MLFLSMRLPEQHRYSMVMNVLKIMQTAVSMGCHYYLCKNMKKERKKRFRTLLREKNRKRACHFESMWNVSLVNKRHHITDTNEWQILQDFYHKSTAWAKTFVSIENVVVLITFFPVHFLCATIEIGKWVQIWDGFRLNWRSNNDVRWHFEKETISNNGMWF